MAGAALFLMLVVLLLAIAQEPPTRGYQPRGRIPDPKPRKTGTGIRKDPR